MDAAAAEGDAARFPEDEEYTERPQNTLPFPSISRQGSVEIDINEKKNRLRWLLRRATLWRLRRVHPVAPAALRATAATGCHIRPRPRGVHALC
jgi:hypothetical protein